MAEPGDLDARITRIARRADVAAANAGLLDEIETVLSEGYAHALALEASRRQLDEQLAELMPLDEPGPAKEARRIALERRGLERRIADLRDRLEGLRDEFARLAGSP